MSILESDPLKRSQAEPGLNRLFLGVLFLAMMIPAVLAGGWLIRSNFEQASNADYVAVAQHYGSVLESGMIMPLWNLSSALGKPVLESISADRSVVSIEVLLQDGESFLEFQRFENPTEAEVVEIERPVIYNDVQLGKIKLAYSLERAQEQSYAQVRLLASVFLVQAAVVLLVMFFFWRIRVSLPLSRLLKSVDGIVAGDLHRAVPESGVAEFALLSRRLDAMRMAVNSEMVLLERRVEERTKELSSLNTSLRTTLDQLHQTYDALMASDKLAALSHVLLDVQRRSAEPVKQSQDLVERVMSQHKQFQAIPYDQLSELSVHQYNHQLEVNVGLLEKNISKVVKHLVDTDLVGIASMQLERRPTSVQGLLKEMHKTMTPAIQRTPYEVILNTNDKNDVALDTFPHALGQVCQHIVANALLHAFESRPHGTLVISTKLLAKGVEITFSDDGVGISLEREGSVFDRIDKKQGQGEMRSGMHIVKILTTNVLGGDVQIESEPNVGTTVVLTVPLSAPGEKPHSASASKHRSSA